ncbi:MAG: monovalent cation/H+ antiporter subunit D family protein [Desulfobacterales bacterium]|nr:monovalent cation/H+ antiporter subunit D family protein [Desulfobacterales bacterium]
MTPQLPMIIICVPLMVAIVIAFTGPWTSVGQGHKNLCFFLVSAAMLACFWGSITLLNMVGSKGIIEYRLGGWAPPMGIVLRIDHLNAFMLVLISFIGLTSAVHGKKSVDKELPDKTALFWCLYLLFITGLFGITMTGDLFNLFVFLEVASLTGYALVAAGSKKATFAGFRYLILGSVGASFYLLGVGYLYIATGTLNMADLATILPGLYHSKTILLGFGFMLVGVSIKTALFPMHIWLPDAYTYAVSAVSAMIAPLTTKVMAYVMIRVMFTVFEPRFSVSLIEVADILVWMGSLAIIFGAVSALSQTDFKRMLSYIIIAEIGYIVGGVGLANPVGLKGAVFHIINDAVMMACLFYVAGQISYQKAGQTLDDFNGLLKHMPVTAVVFTIGALAVIGVPPLCGFFSKWYLLLGGIQAKQWGFVGALACCTVINIALFFRLFDRVLFGHSQSDVRQLEEAPKMLLVPSMVMALVLLGIGIFNQYIVNDVLGFKIL